MHPFRFFKRYNKVVLDVAAVERERGRLEHENEDLRQLLKTFLDGIRWVAGCRHCLVECREELDCNGHGNANHPACNICH